MSVCQSLCKTLRDRVHKAVSALTKFTGEHGRQKCRQRIIIWWNTGNDGGLPKESWQPDGKHPTQPKKAYKRTLIGPISFR